MERTSLFRVPLRTKAMPSILLMLMACLLTSCSQSDRIDALLSQMTLDEKCGQLTCPIGFNFYGKEGDSLWLDDSFTKRMDTLPLGACWAVLRADPWSRKTVETGLQPGETVRLLNRMQRYAVEQTRLGIPMLFCEETPHGHQAVGTTVFPTGLGMASTWNPDLLQQVGEVMGLELQFQGAHVGFGPVLDIARDPRWSRVEETLGEDPYLAGILGSAIVKGMQRYVVATLKHLAAHGVPQGGHNAAAAEVGTNRLMSDYLPPFEQAVKEAGARAVMTAYNSIDGIPCTAHPWLIQHLLREQWQFQGLVFADLNAINALFATHHVAADPAEAAALALKAGVDIDLGGFNYGGYLKEALHRGLVTEADIDRAVRHVLQLKEDLGLFDHPYLEEEVTPVVVGCGEHADLAWHAALESAVLLKNNGLLPFDRRVRKVAVIGPNADNMYNQLGDYTAPQDPDRIVTLFEGIRDKGMAEEVRYARGCAVRDEGVEDIDAAVRIARWADAVVLVVGGSSARDFQTSYEATGAAIVDKHISDMDCGEGYDRSTLKLLGNQEELMRRIYDLGKPVVTVYIQGRPLDMNLAAERSDALLTMWYPGMEGGNALADILWNDYNPSGRLPISIPRSVGQLPVCYSQPAAGDYVEESSQPLYPFGYGLSYTQFAYSDLQVETLSGQDTLCRVGCLVTNTGPCRGEEVAQLYVRDEVASVAPASKRLKGFKKVFLESGESQRVVFSLTARDLSVYDGMQGWHVEPGAFSLMVGGSSADIRLEQQMALPDGTVRPD